MHVPIEHRAQIVNSIADVQHEHNSWDVVRSRKDLTTVRCRECQYQVKMKDVRRCEEFAERRRCRRVGCREMHVHQQKMSLEERVKKYGSGVLERVPLGLRKGLDGDADEPPALLDPDDESNEFGPSMPAARKLNPPMQGITIPLPGGTLNSPLQHNSYQNIFALASPLTVYGLSNEQLITPVYYPVLTQGYMNSFMLPGQG
eukprot:TRINITY_DN1011_c0_g1_i4.p1 TRINITY_DN1011_c0_g1~~TRINITY_DN1011_c0_g1_i4.p1  ORF type:complete len:202 (+),score=65.52 TRINITY_DN1011_c0_g1_i4:75-680(+)